MACGRKRCGYSRSKNWAARHTRYYRKYKECVSVTHKQIQPISGVILPYEKKTRSATPKLRIFQSQQPTYPWRERWTAHLLANLARLLNSLLGYLSLGGKYSLKNLCEGKWKKKIHNNHRENRRKSLANLQWLGGQKRRREKYIGTPPAVIDDVHKHCAQFFLLFFQGVCVCVPLPVSYSFSAHPSLHHGIMNGFGFSCFTIHRVRAQVRSHGVNCNGAITRWPVANNEHDL